MNVKRCFLSCLAIAGLGLASCASPPVSIAFSSQGKTRYLRCNLKAFANVMYVTNYIPPSYPVAGMVGSPTEVNMFSQQLIEVSVNKIPYKMYPSTVPIPATPDQFLGRYLTDDKEKLGLDKMEATKRQNIQAGLTPSIGMTKEEVYMILGPPLFVDFDYDATALSYEAIMDKNRWVYATGKFWAWYFLQVFQFSEGKLTTTFQ